MDCGNAWRMSCLKSKTKNDMAMDFNILAVTENGRKVISEEAAKELLRIDSEIDALNASKTELRNLILDAMIENNLLITQLKEPFSQEIILGSVDMI